MKTIPSYLDVNNLAEDYSFFIASLGFERRARYIAETLRPKATHHIAWNFKDRQTYSYLENKHWFSSNEYSIIDTDESDCIPEELKAILENASNHSNVIGCIDISSMTRKRMAAIVELLCDGCIKSGSSIDFLYSLGAYSPPSTEIAPNTHFGPISPFFAGWTTNPNKPPIAIVGLGYEESKALGATEYIQADEAWAFIPESPIEAYLPAVLEANATFLSFLSTRQKINYRPDDPVGCYSLLESLLYGVAPFGRPIILPFGPKIFTLMALLACTKYSEASVWRVSAQENEIPADRLPSDYIIGVRVTFHN
ncbi:hypothetical protein NP590_09700 [Methylomonas sp. SURF-2]|uniref:Uncharacterized protein n=1 Tax=Methylomonas subterranea TaxID=2952225 RepID=A0ABT1TFZ6_9GAMM|nr:hypothetical protein [Methylomonas sp. SURF-2]MCQ8104375.1 hypothetical protein [Methylomonas sp. SURF-2]